ncbi:MAG: hypothetical protein ACO3FI_12465, partial [Cyclobacteriaceae bacterium]
EEIKSSEVKELRINGQTPESFHKNGVISWYRFPSEDPGFPEQVPAGSLMVWQFNGKDDRLLMPTGTLHLKASRLDTIIHDSFQKVRILYSVFTSDSGKIYPDKVTIHCENLSSEDLKVEQIRLWLPRKGGSSQILFPMSEVSSFISWPSDRSLKHNSKSIIRFSPGELPLTYVAIEVIVSGKNGEVNSLWAHQKIKSEKFDISAGWANGNIGDKPGFLNERFLKTLQSLYINTAHYTGQKDFTDNNSLYSRYPLKYFGHLKPWQSYDYDSLLPRLHGVEILGEPQYGGGKPVDPQFVNTELIPYQQSRLITTLTHSEERIWRYYSGLSDYPHYDAYRVTAPSADEWHLYDRWNGKRIRWGSPLETIGTMTRSLKRLNRPWPVAYWSQGPHEGWEVYGGRQRKSPTEQELRAQACHALACGITSLYWFNLSYNSLVMFPELLVPMQRIGREIRLLERFYLTGTQWDYRRIMDGKNPQWDLSTLVSPEGIVMFALDLDYRADHKTKTFIFRNERKASFDFKVAEWVKSDWKLLKIGAEQIEEKEFQINSQTHVITFSDVVSLDGIYILLPDSSAKDSIVKKFTDLLQQERDMEFKPSRNMDLRGFINPDSGK